MFCVTTMNMKKTKTTRKMLVRREGMRPYMKTCVDGSGSY